MTLFLYLSDVEGGGATRFPQLPGPDGTPPLDVVPRKGKAVLWPSVLDADPAVPDPRTEHEAMAVTAGVKFGANAWVHLYDFHAPNRGGCTG